MKQAVILAGGKATRMRPYTDDRPKAMIDIAGVPIIERQLRWMAANGVEDVVVSCGYKAAVIADRLKDGSELGMRVIYAEEPEPLGRGGGLKFGAGHLPNKQARWLGINGDVLTDLAIDDLVKHHEALGAFATIALAPYRTSWGIAELEGDLVRGFVQSPRLPYWINGGIYVMEPQVAGMLPDKGDHEDTTFPELAKAGKLGGFRITGYWRGIDTVKDIIEASGEAPI